MSSTLGSTFGNTDMWTQMIDNRELLESQYDVVAGEWPDEFNEVVIVADKNNQITDFALYALGIRNSSELKDLLINMDSSNTLYDEATSYTYEDLLDLKFKLVLPSSYYQYDEMNKAYKDMSSSDSYVKKLIDNGIEIKVSGIIVASKDAVATSIMGTIA
jgi:putative ABC transport system permease protein